MFQVTRIDHQLQQRPLPNGVWRICDAGYLRDPAMMAMHGKLNEALDAAYCAQVKNYGHTRDMEFQIVTTSTTQTTLFNPAPGQG